jgi:hypothetical protein
MRPAPSAGASGGRGSLRVGQTSSRIEVRVMRPRTRIDRRSHVRSRCARVSRPRARIDRRSHVRPFLCFRLTVLCGDILRGVCQSDQLPQPAIGHHHIIIQHHQVFAARRLQPLVDRGREPQVFGIGDDRDRHGRTIRHTLHVNVYMIRLPVIDDDQFPRRPGKALESGDTLPGKFKLVPARDDDRCQSTDRAHSCNSPRKGQSRMISRMVLASPIQARLT